MTDSVDTEAPSRRTMYIAFGVIFLVLIVIGLVVFSSAKSNAAAEDKADQLISELNAAGLRAPSKDQIVHVLGDDGGALCDDPSGGLRKAILYGMLTNGSGGPGLRPIIADNEVVQGQLAVIKVYCPDELPDFAQVINDLKFDDVVKD
jgi:hypothetical protein